MAFEEADRCVGRDCIDERGERGVVEGARCVELTGGVPTDHVHVDVEDDRLPFDGRVRQEGFGRSVAWDPATVSHVALYANLTGNIAFTMVMAVITLIVTVVNGNKNYWSHIFLPHAPVWTWPIIIPIEILGIFTKPFALMIRLFANITAGHIIIISLVGLIFMFKTLYIAPVAVAFALFIDVLEVLVAFLQAYIFTMLTALFIGGAVADHTGDGAHTSDDEVAAAKH